MAEGRTSSWIGPFDELGAEDQNAVAQLIRDGGAVVGNLHQIVERLKRTKEIALLREVGAGRIIGAAALKTPDPGYRIDKFQNAGEGMGGYEGAMELGYVVVADNMRGRRLSGWLVDLIAERIGDPVFATTDDGTMKKNLLRAGFTRLGREWKGNRGMLSLWVRDRQR